MLIKKMEDNTIHKTVWVDTMDIKFAKEHYLKLKRGSRLLNDWVYGWNYHSTFDRDTIKLSPFDTAMINAEIISINPDQTLSFWCYRATMMGCGNHYYIRDSISTWQINEKDQKIILSLCGGYDMSNQFKKKIEYKIDSSQTDKLILVETKTYYDLKKYLGDKSFK